MTENKREQGQDRNRQDSTTHENIRENAGLQEGSADTTSESTLDEKSSGMGIRHKGTGLATKDGLTGSDLDGQVTG